MESFAHKAAKELVAQWLREAAAEVGWDKYTDFLGIFWRVNRPTPYWGVWTEYPILEDGTGVTPVWDETEFGVPDDEPPVPPPSYEILVAAGRKPKIIVDVAIQHKGMLHTVIEVVHKNPPPAWKLDFLERQSIERYVQLPTRWVLGQVTRPISCPPEFWRIGSACTLGLSADFR